MPKESFVFKSFETGLSTHQDDRDIENTSVPFSDGFSFSHKGKIKLLGDGWEDTGEALNEILNDLEGTFINNLLTFRYDYDLGMPDNEDYFTPEGSLTGYEGEPKFRIDGVTYYIVPTGSGSNQLSIIAQYLSDDGVMTFTTIKWNEVTKNSSYYTNNAVYPPSNLNPLKQQFSGQSQQLRVGEDANADIVGYFVNGGFRYCDANFENKNNNIVGYFGHINQRFLTELTSVPVPGTVYATADMSFTRNHWHADSYEHYETHSTNPDADPIRDLTMGFPNMTAGVWQHSSQAHTSWTSDDQAIPNYKVWMYCAPNTERWAKEDTSDGTGWDAGEPIYSNQNQPTRNLDDFRYRDTLDSGHELKRMWQFGISTCYDGDPQGICQETGITTWSVTGNKVGDTDKRISGLTDLKNGHSTKPDPDDCWDAILDNSGTPADEGWWNLSSGSHTSSPDNFYLADINALPQLYFTWTFMPWWADHDDISPEQGDKLQGSRPLYDGRITGFRVYMQDIEDIGKKWHNVATIDALRGVVTYEGCNVEQHPWIPRGNTNEMLGEHKPYRLEHGDSTNLMQQYNTPVWSNITTARNMVTGSHGAKQVHLTNFWGVGYKGSYSWVKDLDPYEDSGCNESLVMESIPDITYELLNGYKDNFSPTVTDKGHHSYWSGLIPGDPDDEESLNKDYRAIQKSWGDVYRFKTATVLSDKVYIGNIMNTTTKKVYPDRILKTEHGQHDIFPDDGYHYIDLATGDGDSIVHMENYFGKLFVWKHNSLYIIKITDEGDEMIEATHHHYGIDNKHCVVLTKHGPVWFNNGGVYLYDMEGKVHNLITEKINRGKYIEDYLDDADTYISTLLNSDDIIKDLFAMNYIELPSLQEIVDQRGGDIADYIARYTLDALNVYTDIDGYNSSDMQLVHAYINQIQFGWQGFVGSDGFGGTPKSRIGYIAKDDKIVIVKNGTDSGMNQSSGDTYIFDFYTKNWSYGRKLFPYGDGVFKSNFINDAKGNLIYFYSQDNSMTEETSSGLKQWNDNPKDKEFVQLLTKDIDFESPGVRKSIHKVYISVAGNVDPNVKVLYAINGSKEFHPLNTFDNVQNYDYVEGFKPPYSEFDTNDVINNWYTAILKPNSDGESVKNIYSFQLMFVGKNQLDINDGNEYTVNKDFQINDITIIYRSKNAR